MRHGQNTKAPYERASVSSRQIGQRSRSSSQWHKRTQPHAEATYRVIPIGDGSFAVEVSIPESIPAKVSPFASEADAEAWIAEHRRRMQSENKPRRWYRSSGSSGTKPRGSG